MASSQMVTNNGCCSNFAYFPPFGYFDSDFGYMDIRRYAPTACCYATDMREIGFLTAGLICCLKTWHIPWHMEFQYESSDLRFQGDVCQRSCLLNYTFLGQA